MNSSNVSKTQKRVHGIYDINTFLTLKKRDYFLFGFDFRPRSLNFLPQHQFFEIIENGFNPLHRYFLNYANEPDFVTQKMLKDLSVVLASKGGTMNNIILEFSDERPIDFYRSFKTPYVWHLEMQSHFLVDIFSDPLCEGVVIDLSFEKNLINSEIQNRINYVTKIWNQYKKGQDITLILNSDWENSLNQLDFLVNKSLIISHPINANVEICYRNVDLVRLNKNIIALDH